MRLLFFSLFLSLFFITSISFSFAKTTFNGEAYIYGTSRPTSVDVFAEKAEGTSVSNPHKIYIPVNTDATDLERQNNNEISPLPLFNENLYVQLNLYSDTDHKANYYVAILSSGDTYTTITEGVSVNGSTNSDAASVVTFSLKDFGSYSKLNLTTTSVKQSQFIYIFTADSKPTTFNILNEYKDGVHFELKFSNNYDSSNAPTINSVTKGDSKLFVSYSASKISSEIIGTSEYRKTILLIYRNPQESMSYQSAIPLGSVNNTETNLSSGAIWANDLKNGETYHVAVAIVNKYRFVSKVSASSEGTPIEILNFLEEQGCYLVSAGFKRNHYVLDYFRMIRDSYLNQSSLGRAFVNFYYSFAFDWALVVYKSETLSFLVRAAAYTIYFLLNNLFLIVTIFAATTIIIIIITLLTYSPKAKPSERGSDTP
ncbi:MAG: hypothetical protein HQK49_12280 [Oligoflexia bacterium]|nr:hypothetical protein [Oligoflexia bacterium]